MDDKRRLIHNIIVLAVLRGANYLLPLVTLPYLVRVLGAERFGIIALAQGVATYFIVFVDYGFNLSATRDIAVSRNEPERVSLIYSAVLASKVVLLLVALILFSAVVWGVPRFRQDAAVFYVMFASVVASALFPLWLYQGLERMRPITAFNIIAKLIGVIAIFALVHVKNDYLLAAAIQSGTTLAAALAALFAVKPLLDIRLTLPGGAQMRAHLVEGWHVFTSTAAISLYTTTNTVVVGLIAGNAAVGMFSAADKLIRAVLGLLDPIAQAVFPHINAVVASDKRRALVFLRKLLLQVGSGALLVSATIFVFARPIVFNLYGPAYSSVVILIRWMAFLPFIIALSNVMGIQTLLTFGFKREFSHIVVVAGIVNLAMLIPLVGHVGAPGAAAAVLVTELLVTSAMFVVLRNRGLRIWRRGVGYEG